MCLYIPLMLALTHWPNLTPAPPELQGLQLDKLVHFVMYLLLTVGLVRARLLGPSSSDAANLVLGAGLAALLGIVDEYTQRFVPGRTVSVFDAIANLAAVGSATIALGITQSRWKGRTVAAWVCRVVLCLLLPYLGVLTFGPSLNLEHMPLAIAPALGLHLQADKLAHLAGATVLTWLIYGAQFLGVGRRRYNLLFTMVVMALMGPVVELVQSTQGRGVELADIAAHNFGLGIGLAVILAAWTILALAKPVYQTGTRWAETTLIPSDQDTQDRTLSTRSESASPPRKAGFAGAALVVSALTLLSRLTGLARDVYLAAVLGLSGVADAFWFGFQIPNLFRRLFGEGALTAAFIPVYTQGLAHDPLLARRFVSLCFAVTLIVLGTITLLGELTLAGVLWGGKMTGDWALAIRLTMLMLPYMPMVCLVALCGAVMQVHGRFAPTAGMPVFLNLVMIAGAWLAMRGLTPENDGALHRAVYFIAGFVVLAGLVQLAIQTALMLRHEKLTLVFREAGPLFTQFRRAFLPSFLALAVFQINTFIDALLAMTLSPKQGTIPGPGVGAGEQLNLLGWWVDYPIAQGGLAALNNAQRLYQFPLGVFGVAIATAIFPLLAHAAAGRLAGASEFRRILQQGLRLTVFIGLPASAGLILTSLPLSRVLFERGAFTLEDSQRVAWVLVGYAPAIWAYSMSQVLTRAFYALRDMRTPMVLSMAMVVLNFLLNITLVWGLGVSGLAWATALCATVQCLLLLMLIRRRLDPPPPERPPAPPPELPPAISPQRTCLEAASRAAPPQTLIDRSVWIGWGKTAGLSLVMALVIAPLLVAYPPLDLNKSQATLQLLVMVGLGTGVYLGGAYVLKCPEMHWLRRRRR